MPSSLLQPLLSLVKWSVVWYHWNRQDCKRKHSQAIASFPQKLSYDWYSHLRMEHTCHEHSYYLISFIYSLNKYLLISYAVPSTLLDAGDTEMNKQTKYPCLVQREKNWEHLSQTGCCFFHSFLFLCFDTSFQGGPNPWFNSVCLRICRLFYHRTALHRKLS